MRIFLKSTGVLMLLSIWAFLAYTTWFGLVWGFGYAAMGPLYVFGLAISAGIIYFLWAT
jgi:hypothetical protein